MAPPAAHREPTPRRHVPEPDAVQHGHQPLPVRMAARLANAVPNPWARPRAEEEPAPQPPPAAVARPVFKLGEIVEGAQVEYCSESNKCWMPCLVLRVDDDTGAVTLSVRPATPLDRKEQQKKLRPRSRPNRHQLEWVRKVLREGRIESEARTFFSRFAVRRPGGAVLEDVDAAGRALEEKLGIMGCVCTLRAFEEQQDEPPAPGGLFETAFCEAFWDLLWVVQRDYYQALPSDGLVEQACPHDPDKVYHFEKKLGEGTYGCVVLAYRRSTGEKCAVKLIGKKMLRKVGMSLQVEIERLRALDHPHIVKLYEHYEDNKNVYLVMDFCTGGDLAQLVQERKAKRTRIQEDFISIVMRQVMLAIAHVHARGIVHLDLKTLNIMLTSSRRTLPPGRAEEGATLAAIDARPHVMVIDLGVAQIFRPGNFKDNRPSGTPLTMAPEVWKGEVHPKSDVYSCGVVLFELLSFSVPYRPPCNLQEALKYWEKTHRVDWSWEANRSREAVSLCRKMLRLARHSRPSAASCLQEHFLEETNEVLDSVEQVSVPMKIIEMMASAPKRSVLHKSVALSIARVWPGNQLPTIKRIFESLDIAQNGRLNLDELEALLRQAGGLGDGDALEAADAMDLNRDGTVCWTEFVAACIDLGSDDFDRDLRKIFDDADTDKDGFLGQRDIAGLLAAKHLRSELAAGDLFAEIAGSASRLDFRTFRRHFRSKVKLSRPQGAGNGARAPDRAEPARAEPVRAQPVAETPGIMEQARGFAFWARDAVWPAEEPRAAPPQEVDQQELRRLAEMGFTDRRRCTEVLLRNGNKVTDFVIAELVASGEFH